MWSSVISLFLSVSRICFSFICHQARGENHSNIVHKKYSSLYGFVKIWYIIRSFKAMGIEYWTILHQIAHMVSSHKSHPISQKSSNMAPKGQGQIFVQEYIWISWFREGNGSDLAYWRISTGVWITNPGGKSLMVLVVSAKGFTMNIKEKEWVEVITLIVLLGLDKKSGIKLFFPFLCLIENHIWRTNL